MNIQELYDQTPSDRQQTILISGDRVVYDGVEYLLLPDGELRLVHSYKETAQKLEEIAAILGL